MSTYLNNYIRSNVDRDRKDINKILEALHDIYAAPAEDEALKERIILSPHNRKRSQTLAKSGSDVSSTKNRTRRSSSYTVLPYTSSPPAYPVSNTLNGTLTLLKYPDWKYGSGATFNGTQYIEIPHNTALEVTRTLFSVQFWFKSTTFGQHYIYCKKDLASSNADYLSPDYDSNYLLAAEVNAGIEVYLVADDGNRDFINDGDYDSNYFTEDRGITVNCGISDGTNSLLVSKTASGLFDGNWHSVTIVSKDVADYLSPDYDSNYSVSGGETVEILVDKVSKGSVSNSSITGSLTNTRNAYFGAGDNDGSLVNKMVGSVALFTINEDSLTSTEIDNYHDSGRIVTREQKNALFFTGNEESSVNDNIF